MSPFIPYADMKTKYPIEILELRHQPDHITPRKIQLYQEDSADPEKPKILFNINWTKRNKVDIRWKKNSLRLKLYKYESFKF